VNCDLINSKNLTIIKLGMCTVNVLLCQLQVKYYMVKLFIVECNFYVKLSNHSFLNFFLCFDVKNSPLKFVQAI
jgi:hypothetical protein